jgi:amidohydrolase
MTPQQLTEFRKELHRRPELSGHEEATAKKVAAFLESLKPDELITGLGGTGVMARFEPSGEPVQTILFRAELDAIAVEEESDIPHRSANPGIMHGCGHDGHMTILAGLAMEVSRNRPVRTRVLVLYQPAEETGEGAQRVLADDRFKQLQIDHAFALHNLPGFPENSIVVRSGVFASASAGFEVRWKGRSSHAAYPEHGINPAAAMTSFLIKTEEYLAGFRSSGPQNKAVNTFIRLGEPAFGISPGSGKAGFTLRSPDDEILNKAIETLKELADETTAGFDGNVETETVEPFAATVNSREGVRVVMEVAERSGLQIIEQPEPFPWSEDFGRFGEKCPVTLFGLGAGESSEPLHSEHYDFNDSLIPAGTGIFSEILQYCDPNRLIR